MARDIHYDKTGTLLPKTGKYEALLADGAMPHNDMFEPGLIAVLEGKIDAAAYVEAASDIQYYQRAKFCKYEES